MQFQNKIVLVTGGSRGIGASTVKAFAKEGATVCYTYKSDVQKASELKASLPDQNHSFIQCDLSNPEIILSTVEQVIAKYGRIDVLVNNVGMHEDHEIDKVDYQLWQQRWHETLNINLIGTANMIYCVAQHMIKQRSGRIVNVSSRGAFRGEPTFPAYGASKAGMNSLGQSMAIQLAPYNIFVGTVAPGFVQTDLTAEKLNGPKGVGIRAQSPHNRVARPEEVAHAILFLASKGSEWTTGTIIDVNGASYLRS